MQFIYDGVYHKVARITGPAHNVLALRLASAAHSAAPFVEHLRIVRNSGLDCEAVKREVLAGVDEANGQCGTNFRVVTLQYAEDDTPPESTYRLLAFSLVERLAKDLPFTRVSTQP